VVVLAYALHHLPDVEHFLDRLGKWLDPQARLIINEENPKSPLFRIKHLVRGIIQRDTETEWHRSVDAWQMMLRRFGFATEPDLVGLDPFQFPWPKGDRHRWSLVFGAKLR
jgi:hypothetical protein